jgi:asparagine synthase (glutamine-hydrolysing)
MCGLAGRFDPRRLSESPGWSQRASTLLAHRGPDGAGCFRDDRCELVHRRLALIDLSPTGHQPMPNEDDRVWVVFNGEIYNHANLRHRLQGRGHRFRGTSDTEVLVHLYEELGTRMVEQLRGIFAFALYDVLRRRLLLARDRFGVKPLYYANHGDEWLFASELKAMLAVQGFAPALDRQACYDFLAFGYVPEPATGFAGVFALPPGSFLVVSPQRWQLHRYYRVAASAPASTQLDDAADAAGERLLAAVASQSVADVPVAALLSGGVDSSLVVAAHRRAATTATTTFNVRFPDPRHDETAVAHAVAAACGTTHHTIDASERALAPEAVLDLLRHFDQPFADTSCIPMFWVSSAVRDRGIICALSGDGGDEAFGGYARFWRLERLHRLMQAPPVVRGALAMAGRSLTGATRDWGRQVTKAVALADAGRTDTARLLAGFSTYLTPHQQSALVVPDARVGLLPAHRWFDGYESLATHDLDELSRRMTEKLFDVSLPSDMLRKVDMMSMRASIEVRVPLLDEDVVELGLTLPHRLKTDGRSGKLVLRRLASRWLPPRIASHPKHGFSIPLDVMVPDTLAGAIGDLLLGTDSRTRPMLDGAVVGGWIDAFSDARAGGGRGGAISREGVWQRVLMLLSLELWMRDRSLTW